MTRQELDMALARLGLDVPETERDDIANAMQFIEEMTILNRKSCLEAVEPAHIVSFLEQSDDS